MSDIWNYMSIFLNCFPHFSKKCGGIFPIGGIFENTSILELSLLVEFATECLSKRIDPLIKSSIEKQV
jgi:hypothetical protein